MTQRVENHRIHLGAALCMVAVVVAACVPAVEIEGAPCPCPPGYQCCETTMACLGEGELCPDQYPPSSARKCASNGQCPLGEVCQAWTLQGNVLAGPQTCRRECKDEHPCTEGEECGLIVQGGQPLSDMQFSRACVANPSVPGCENLGCTGTDLQNLGKTFCYNNSIRGGFVTLHPQCGVVCQTLGITSCKPDTCSDSASGADCMPEQAAFPLCDEYSCNRRCPGQDPNAPAVCQVDKIVGCLSVGWVECTLCTPFVQPCADGMQCVEDTGAHCASI